MVFLDIQHPASEFLKVDQVFNEDGTILHEKLRDHLKQEGRVEEDVALRYIHLSIVDKQIGLLLQ